MSTLSRRIALFTTFVLVCFFVLLLPPLQARADVGVQPVLPGGSNIQPQEQTPVQMAAEVVTITVRPATAEDNAILDLNPEAYGLQTRPVWFVGIAEVEAVFTMKNPTRTDFTLTAWFPLASALPTADWNLNPEETVPTIVGFQVFTEDIPVAYAVSSQPNPQGVQYPPLPWASFPLSFPADSETRITVRYHVPLQPSIKGHEMALYYIFQTGSGWAGSIGSAELILNLPYPATSETIAGIVPEKFYLPPMNVGGSAAGLPAGAVLEGNQARWLWTDFEPTPQDDFAIWLLQPQAWQQLQAARTAVEAAPQNGIAWLQLAVQYHALSVTDRNYPLVFSPVYLPQGIQAYRKAAELLPAQPAPHAGIGLLLLAPYTRDKNAPPEILEEVQQELAAARRLQADTPPVLEDLPTSRWLLGWLEDALYNYFYNEATATAQVAAMETDLALQTETPAFTAEPPTITPQPTTLALLIPTITPPPSAEPPVASPSPLIIAGGALSLALAALYALRQVRRR